MFENPDFSKTLARLQGRKNFMDIIEDGQKESGLPQEYLSKAKELAGIISSGWL